uniref:NAD-dependent epimerase/dehydratase family protein n=1 Tax=Janibacter limosus TaxID=53458 RepID=A0AC61U5F8_9MICO|nr:NAD-dependent epimerase/dehydratase family protein [Janibacter limosus]
MRRPGLLHDRGPRMLLPCVAAALDAGVGKVVHLSSVAAYAPGSGGERVDETRPLEGAADSPYARGKAPGEKRLDVLARSRSAMDRVAVLRPCLVGQRRAGAQMARYGLPAVLAATRAVRHLPWVPGADGFALQMVHSDDVARAVVASIEQDASGPFNLAGEGTLGGREIAGALGARPVRLPRGLPRLAAAAARHTHTGPLDPTTGRHGRTGPAHGHGPRPVGPGVAPRAPCGRRPPRGRRRDAVRRRWRERSPAARGLGLRGAWLDESGVGRPQVDDLRLPSAGRGATARDAARLPAP